jgi:hypothetical protein
MKLRGWICVGGFVPFELLNQSTDVEAALYKYYTTGGCPNIVYFNFLACNSYVAWR